MFLLQDKDVVVFAGDSVTDAGRKRPFGEGLWEGVGTGFVRAFDTLLNVCDPEHLYRVINMGIGGNTSADLLTRWNSDIIDLHPDVIVCCIGINDVWRQFDEPTNFSAHISLEEYRANLEQMAASAAKHARLTVFMTPYYMETDKNDRMRKRMDEYGEITKEIAANHQFPCIDLQAEFDEYLAFRHSTFLTWDKIHPNGVASMIIARSLLKTMGFEKNLL